MDNNCRNNVTLVKLYFFCRHIEQKKPKTFGPKSSGPEDSLWRRMVTGQDDTCIRHCICEAVPYIEIHNINLHKALT